MRIDRRIIGLIFVLVLIVGAIGYLETQRPDRAPIFESAASRITPTNKTSKADRFEAAHELVAPAGFVNTNAFKISDLIGKKVILVDFWTYSCINCQRTLPYLTSWYNKYHDQGLEIVGVHTPEFEFEHKLENVTQAVKQWGITYPVVLDNDYGTWNAYGNRYWPHKYLIDIDGYIVYDHVGEGGYEETERKIQELLAERKTVLNESGTVPTDITQPNAETINNAMTYSPETYFGSARNNYLGNGRKDQSGVQQLTAPATFKLNALYLDGSWDFQSEYAQNQSSGAKIIYRYQAQRVFLVAHADQPVRLRLTIDGQPIGSLAGADVIDGIVTVNDSRLYRLIEDKGWGEHTLEIEILDPGLQAFTFTFG